LLAKVHAFYFEGHIRYVFLNKRLCPLILQKKRGFGEKSEEQ